ncbi:hypothetical protein C4D60_Mb10t25660 [Musa balbisiana]|uniref:Uncharacterized protein n=1 Tax=Musa balbisiana TaxID=52838 RepID=A0A4S8IZU6_MUSBA|nr:hypothetical protein C4D60_Mb10t25660 [Musa balbisiana]
MAVEAVAVVAAAGKKRLRLLRQAAPTSANQDTVLQQSYHASTNPANQDHMIQGWNKELERDNESCFLRKRHITAKKLVQVAIAEFSSKNFSGLRRKFTATQ